MSRQNTVEAAAGHWDYILSHFIGPDFLKYTRKEGPCPNCGGKTRFRYDNKNGSGSFYCRHCGSGYGIDLLQRIKDWSFKEAATAIDKLLGKEAIKSDGYTNTKVDHTATLNNISSALTPISRNGIVDYYLKNRGIAEYNPAYFRQLPNFPYYNEDGKVIGKADCMCCRIVNNQGQRIGYHLTYLLQGMKAEHVNPKMTPSRKVRGTQRQGVIPLGDYRKKCAGKKMNILAIAEGIETALAYTQHNGHVCWSAINATNLPQFNPPADVDALIIVADNDESYTGLYAASKLAKRLANEIKQNKTNLKMLKLIVPIDRGDYLDVAVSGTQTACF